MVDNDGNTALHLAVEARSFHMFCPLLGNPRVNLNLPNNMGETPFDIAEYKIPKDGGELTLYNGLVIHLSIRSFYSIIFSSLKHAFMHERTTD
jgi:ankyrin repeat protein